MLCLCLTLTGVACGRRGDPIPRPRAAPAACQIAWVAPGRLQVQLPSRTHAEAPVQGALLPGIQKVRVFHLAGGEPRPTPEEVMAKGDILIEQAEPKLPPPGSTVVLDLAGLDRPEGWIVVVAYRVGDVAGRPSALLPWQKGPLQGR